MFLNKHVFITIIIGIMFFFGSNSSAQAPKGDLIGYWSLDAPLFDENTETDILGRPWTMDEVGNIFTILRGNPEVVPGKVRKAFKFNGANAVHLSHAQWLDFNGVNEMSVAAWIKPTSAKPIRIGLHNHPCCGTIVGQRDAGSWVIRYDSRNVGKEINFSVQPGWQGHNTIGVRSFVTNTWHHVVGVVDNDQLLFYVDGKLEDQAPYEGPMERNGLTAEIGGSVSHGGFIGVIDEVYLYKKALSSAEVQQVYNAKGLSVKLQGKLATRWGKIKMLH